MLKLYNTLSRKKEVFKPRKPSKVGMYTCGMTVYDHTHIGHMRTYVNTDILRRVLGYNGFEVKQVENVTDVGHLTSDADIGEDKLQKKARKERKTAWEIAKIYTKEFFETMDALNILRPHVVAFATEHIQEMSQLVQELEKRGFTYIIPDDGVYFDTSKLLDYGKLARLDVKGLRAGARVKIKMGKKNITDFALWKFSKKEEKRDMEWESPWSKRSFPGWHIECSTLSMKYLSHAFDKGKFDPERFETIDLHTGGVDHISVHHTNEIAQTEAATGKKFVNYWFHNEFLMVEGEKMSKSLGNFFWIKDIKERNFDPMALRYLFLGAHYRSKMNFTWEGLRAAANTLEKLRQIIRELYQEQKEKANNSQKDLSGASKKYEEKFLNFINDDLNMSKALAVMWKLIKDEKVSPQEKFYLLLNFDKVFGLSLKKVKEIKIPQKVKELVKQREKYRKNKDWKKSDEIRKQIKKLGYLVEDIEKGFKIKKA